MDFKKIALSSAITAILAGCGADDQAYDYLSKDENQVQISSITSYEPVTDYNEVKEIPLPGVWMYRPSTSSAPRDADMYAYFAGGEVLVTLSLTKDGLVAKRIDPDVVKYDPNNPQVLEESRWADNIDLTRVLEIPGTYTAYQCSEDNYGDCTNKEEEVDELDAKWYERSHFLPDYEGLKAYINDINDYYGSDALSTEVAMKEFDPANGVINIELERHFKDGNGKARFFYSFVRLDKYADANYTPIYQAQADQNKFGFFTSEFKKADNNNSTSSEFSNGAYLNRFSPNLESIDFYLSDDFFEEGNEIWLRATLETVDTMAAQMEAAGVPPVKIINRDSAANIASGDLRYNAINMFAEPSDAGLLGYGPSAANPLTGEIISAFTNMYPGTILRTVPRQWDQFARLYNARLLADQATVVAEPEEGAVAVASQLKVTNNTLNERQESVFDTGYVLPDSERLLEFEMKELRTLDLENQVKNSEGYANLFGEAKEAVDAVFDKDKVEEFWSRNTMFSANNVWVSSTEKNGLPGIDFDEGGYFDSNNELKDFDQLNSLQKEQVSEVFGVHNYKTTLVHELGHNLGLRHNFEGSADKANFYTQEQADQMGLRGIPAATSIMDYAPSELDIEPVLGAYDIAALKVAYARVVEDQDGNIHSLEPFDAKYRNQYEQADIPTNTERSPFSPITQLEFSLNDINDSALDSYKELVTAYEAEMVTYNEALAEYQAQIDGGTPAETLTQPIKPTEPEAPVEIATEIKEYGFCTDGNVGSTWDCDRHDEGTDRVESASYHYHNLENFHDMFNFRGEDYSFTERGTIGRYFFFRNRMMDIASHGMQSWGFITMAADYNDWDDPLVFAEAMCVIQDNGEPRWPLACDYYKSAEKAGELMVSMLATPEKTCQVKVTKTSNGSETYENISLEDMYGKVRWDLNENHELPLDCFDATLNAQLAINNASGQKTESYEIVSELKGGQYLNHQTAGSTVNHEMSDWSNYDEIDAFGVWFYRLIAAQQIASRDMVLGGDTAIIDIPSVRKKVDELVRHWTLGSEYSGYQFIDKNGAEVVSQVPYAPDYTAQKIRRLNYPENIIMSWFTYTNRTQDTNLVEATLKSLAYDAESVHPEKKFLARNFIDSISVFDTTGETARADHVTLELDGRQYSAGVQHSIARDMITQAKSSAVFQTEEFLKTQPSLDGVNEFVNSYQEQWDTAIESATNFGTYLQQDNFGGQKLRHPGGHALMTGSEAIFNQINAGTIPSSELATSLHSLIDSLVASGQLKGNSDEDIAATGCKTTFHSGVCIVTSTGAFTQDAIDVINYPVSWIPTFYAEAKEVSRLFDANFLQSNLESELLGKDFDLMKSYIGTDFELLKYQEAKMLEKLPHYDR